MNSRVTTVAIGDKLEKEGAVAVNAPLARKLDTLMRSNDIHAIDLSAGAINVTS
jgi:acid stress-induced BolA-like protein IbaG/YrbA